MSKLEGLTVIKKSEYLALRMAAEELSRLEAGGIDNWEWYSESLNPDDQDDLDTFKEKEEVRIKEMPILKVTMENESKWNTNSKEGE